MLSTLHAIIRPSVGLSVHHSGGSVLHQTSFNNYLLEVVLIPKTGLNLSKSSVSAETL